MSQSVIETSEGQQYTIIAAETGPSPWTSATKLVELTLRAAGPEPGPRIRFEVHYPDFFFTARPLPDDELEDHARQQVAYFLEGDSTGFQESEPLIFCKLAQ
jgi:hypothetical protein